MSSTVPDRGPHRAVGRDVALGVVLCGGASTRMGEDKALLVHDGRRYAAIVADALVGAGCDGVVLVGGDRAALAELLGVGAGRTWRPDDAPGEGPLGGIATAVRAHPGRSVLVCACDLPLLRPEDVAPLLDAVAAGADAAVHDVDGRAQWSAVAMSAPVAAEAADSFDRGERSIRGVFEPAGPAGSWSVRHVRPAHPERLRDVDVPSDRPARRPAGRPAGRSDGVRGYRARVPINEIDVEELATVRDAGGFVLDVRNADEYAEAHVPGVVLIPLDELEARYVELPVVDAIYVICRSGGRSMRAGEFLQSRGINAVNVAGGTLAWIDSGRAVESGASGE